MSLRDVMQSDLDFVLNQTGELAEGATYKAPGGVAIPLTVIKSNHVPDRDEDIAGTGANYHGQLRLTVSKSQLSEVNQRASITYKGKVYAIDEAVEELDHKWMLYLKAPAQAAHVPGVRV